MRVRWALRYLFMSPTSILQQLGGGDRRSIGRANRVVAQVLARPGLFRTLFAGLKSEDLLVRIRSADAIEKITLVHSEWLGPYKAQLIGPLARSEEAEIRWHVAQVLPRLRWTAVEQRRVYRLLTDYLRDGSSIVKTCAMQALADISVQVPGLRSAVLRRLKMATARGTPAMRARGRNILVAMSKANYVR